MCHLGQEELEKAFLAYADIVKLKDSYNIILEDLPSLLTIGEQTCGKSSLLETYFGFPASFIGTGTATKRPVRYILSTSASPKPGFCRVDNQFYEIEKLAEKIENSMKDLKGNFSDTVLTVEIWGAKVNAILTDLPGIITNSKDNNAEFVANIIRNQIRTNKNCHLIIIVNAEDDWQGHTALGEIKEWAKRKEIPDNWHERAIILGSHLDMAIRKFSMNSAKDVESFLQAPVAYGDPIKPIYYSLITKEEDSRRVKELRSDLKNPDSWKELKKFIEKIPEKEKKLLEEFSSRIPNWNPEWNQYFGLENVTKKLDSHFLQAFFSLIPQIKPKVLSEINQASKELSKIKYELELTDPEKRRIKYAELKVKYIQLLIDFFTNKGDKIIKHMPLEKYGTKIAQISDAHGWAYFKSFSDIEGQHKDFIGPDLQAACKFPYYGCTFVKYLYLFFEVLVNAATFPQFSYDQYRAFMGIINYSDGNNFEKAIKEATAYIISQIFESGLVWLSTILQAEITKWNDSITQILKDDYGFAEMIDLINVIVKDKVLGPEIKVTLESLQRNVNDAVSYVQQSLGAADSEKKSPDQHPQLLQEEISKIAMEADLAARAKLLDAITHRNCVVVRSKLIFLIAMTIHQRIIRLFSSPGETEKVLCELSVISPEEANLSSKNEALISEISKRLDTKRELLEKLEESKKKLENAEAIANQYHTELFAPLSNSNRPAEVSKKNFGKAEDSLLNTGKAGENPPPGRKQHEIKSLVKFTPVDGKNLQELKPEQLPQLVQYLQSSKATFAELIHDLNPLGKVAKECSFIKECLSFLTGLPMDKMTTREGTSAIEFAVSFTESENIPLYIFIKYGNAFIEYGVFNKGGKKHPIALALFGNSICAVFDK